MYSTLEQEKMAHGASPWNLVSKSGQTYHLPQTMVFLGRDDKCDIVIESRSVNPHHAILNYDSKENKFKIKDLGSINGTYVNESRIPEEEFFTLDDKDTIRFGYDPTVYHMAQSEESTHHVEPPVPTSQSPTIEVQNVWASRDDSEHIIHGMAECPGCIAEQELQHTCGIHDESTSSHSSHSNQSIAGANKTDLLNQTTHPPTLTQCQHRRSKWHETPYHIDEYPTPYVGAQDYDYFYEDPTAYGAVSAPEGAVGVVPQTYVYDTVADANSHIVHNSTAPIQGPIQPTLLVRHIYHTGAPPQFVAGRLPVNYISTYPDPYLVPHGARIPRGMSFQQEDLSATSYVPDDSVTSAPAGFDTTSDSTPATSINCTSQPIVAQLAVTSSSATSHTDVNHTNVNHTNLIPLSKSVPSFAEDSSNAVSIIQPTGVTYSVASATTNGAIVTEETSGGEQQVLPFEQHERQFHQETQTDLDSFDCDEKPVKENCDFQEAGNLVKSDSFTSSSSRTSGTPGSPPPPHRQDKRRSICSGQDTELETVKKGTPLYGQPSWWGEEDADDYKYPHTSTLTEKDKISTDNKNTAERPLTLNFDHNKASAMASSDKQQTDPQCSVTYMEIPCDSADTKQESSSHDVPHTPPERDTGPSTAEDSPLNKSNTAFTVDFGGEDEEVKAATKNRPIGEFLPSGLRRSFRQREEKIKEMQEKKKGDTATRDQLSGPEMSPARQRKAYNWHSGGSGRVAHKNSLSPQRSGYHSDGHNSNMSSDNEDLSIRSESFAGRAKRIKQTGRSVSVTDKCTSSFSSSRSVLKSTRNVIDKRKSGSGDSRRTPISDNRRTPTTVDNRRTPTSVESRRTPTSVESRRTPTSSERRGKMEHRKTPTGEKKKKSSAVQPVPSDSAYLINKMFASQGSQQDDGLAAVGYEPNGSIRTREHKHKSSVIKPRVSQGEPVMASQKSLRVPKKDDDAHSETGTYTIQGEKEQKEIENARKSIDKVFGVVDHQEYVIEIQRPVIDFGLHSPEDPDYSPGEEEEARMQLSSEDLDELEEELGEQSELHHYNETHKDNEAVTGTSSGWLSQVIRQDKSVTSSTTTEYSANSSPLHQPMRRMRPGTGRKLPSPPIDRSLSVSDAADGSCVESDLSGGRHRATVTFDSGNGGTFLISFDAPQRETNKAGTQSENEASDTERATADADAKDKTSPDIGENTEKMVAETGELHGKHTQKKKIVIIQNDSQPLPVSKEELLIPIKDTDSDTDSSSCAVVRSRYSSRSAKGQQNKEKPKFARSKSTGATAKLPADSARTKSTDRRSATAPRAKSSERKATTKCQDIGQRPSSAPKAKKSSGPRSRTSSTNRDLSTSDGPSESESASIISSSTDYSETSPRIMCKSSGGKGTVLLTRTNRTAVLRRRKLEMESESNRSDSSTLTPRSSRPNSTSLDTLTSPKVSPRASSRSRSSSRSRPLSAQDSSHGLKGDVNLGQRIVGKSRENQRMTGSSKEVSTKYSRSLSCKSTLSSPRSKSETKDLRPQSGKSISSASGLIISGNRSQPSSRSNSPRTQEYNAWKRRKSYDPRQAVAEAKATKKVTHSKPPISDHDKSAPSVSSLSSEDSANLDDSGGESSRTDDIIKLSTEIYKNLAAMSRENDSEEVDILMACCEEFEGQFVSRNLSDAHPNYSLNSTAFSNGQFIDKSHSNSISSEEITDENTCQEQEYEALDVSIMETGKSYNTIILRSIFEISNRVRHKTDALMDKLKRSHDLRNVRGSDKIELDGDSPGLQELGGILSNLRTTERHLQVIDRALFPRPQNRGSLHGSKHVKELERIRSELADFKTVDKPPRTWGKKMHKQGSRDSDRSEPFTGDDYCDPGQIQDA